MYKRLQELRRYLHSIPDVPREEDGTASYLIGLLEKTCPDVLLKGVGGKGIIAIYKGSKPGKAIAVRAELDALPIHETNEFSYRSTKQGVAHSCGHDGHMAIAYGIAEAVSRRRETLSGSVAVLFQPEEETGTGAAKMLLDQRFQDLHFDGIFALHNLPGFEKNSLIIRKGAFTSNTTGMIIRLWGATSHAGQPENGNSPLMAMTAIINSLSSLSQQILPVHRSALLTIIHARIGEIAFGTSPGYAHVMATMRAFESEDLEKMKEKALLITKGIADSYGLRYETEFVESYPAVLNDDRLTEEVIATAEKLKLPVVQRDHPFSWSEDFAFFLKRYPGVLFGLGAGTESPQLHHEHYDFPDELLETGVRILEDLIDKLTK